MLFLPKNTSIEEIVTRLLPYSDQLVHNTSDLFEKKNQLVLEIEQLTYGSSCKALLVSTGGLVNISASEITRYFISTFCNSYGPHSSGASVKSSEKSD